MNYRKAPVLFSKDQIDKMVEKLGKEITKDYDNKPLVLVVVLKGAIIFASDLIRQITVKDMKVDFVKVSSYGVGNRETTGTIKLWKDISVNIHGKHVLIIEEIIDSGLTLKFLSERLRASNPKSVKMCSLLDKKCKRKVDIEPDYVGEVIDDKYVFGYGLDLDELCRNYPDIHYLKSED